MSSNAIHFPFSAICGHSNYKTALILTAIDPLIGGVLVSGPRGVAKSTMARAFFDIIPSNENHSATFVQLPLGTSEEMLTGTLDLEKVLRTQEVAFRPGLLHKAHNGLLYVDEVNLLADNLVDLLLDVAACGMNYIERDGISHSHASQFIFVGTMNPDEGELRPQLLDRFGLMVNLDNQMSIEQRVDIVERRHRFDHNPQCFSQEYAEQQAALRLQIRDAQALLLHLTLPKAVKLAIATTCHAANAEGIRADLALTRAAKAHCAWQGRSQVSVDDVDAVAEMVLCHRRKQQDQGASPPSSRSQDSGNGSGFQRPEKNKQEKTREAKTREAKTREENTQEGDNHQAQGDWGELPANFQVSATLQNDQWQSQQAQELGTATVADNSWRKRQGISHSGSKKGKACHAIDWFKTLIKHPQGLPLNELVRQKKRSGRDQLHCVLLDTSASTLQHELLQDAKAFVLSVQKKAYLAREKLCIFSFGHDTITEVQSFSKAPKTMTTTIDSILAGGGTPLKAMVQKASRFISHLLQRYRGLSVTTYLITDGRTNQSLKGISVPGAWVVVDTEMSPLKIGRCRQIAQDLKAEYMPLPITKEALL